MAAIVRDVASSVKTAASADVRETLLGNAFGRMGDRGKKLESRAEFVFGQNGRYVGRPLPARSGAGVRSDRCGQTTDALALSERKITGRRALTFSRSPSASS